MTRSIPRFLPSVLAGLFAAAAPAQLRPSPDAPGRIAPGWRAELAHAADAGIWYAHVAKVVADYGQNEIIAGDDKGRYLLLTVYSGQWTAHSCTPDGLWLAPTRPADVDPRVPGRELYAGGRAGSLHQIQLRPQPFAKFTLESREIGHVAGEEFHAVVAADLDPTQPGDELLAFAITGAVYAAEPSGEGGFALRNVGQVPGRVRDTALTSLPDGKGRQLLAVSRSGDLLALDYRSGKLTARSLMREDSGLGRLAASPQCPGVVYATRDDGLLLRCEAKADGSWHREPLFAGPQGLRGVAAGRFHADGREAVACHGYGQTVHLLARPPGGAWQVEEIYRGDDKGHWLAVGELDGRNNTDELVATGFDGKVVVLARVPGHGLPQALVPKPVVPGDQVPPAVRPLRLAASYGDTALQELSPLRYQGGFESKALVYETLVRRDAAGRIVPGLATSWRTEKSGQAWLLGLREGACFHDGTPVTAAAVAEHFRRWVGLPEHDWLYCNRRIAAVRAVGERELRIELTEPCALLADLCAINPTAIRGPGALDREGNFVRPVGSGSFAFVEAREAGEVLRYRRHGGTAGELVDLVRCSDPLAALAAGEVDAVFSSWLVQVDPARARALAAEPRFQVTSGPGSSVWHLALRTGSGPLQDLSLRRLVAAAIDRQALISGVVAGFGDPATGFAAPSVRDWPGGRIVASPPGKPVLGAALRLLPYRDTPELAAAVAAQLQRAGLPCTVVDAGDKDWDLRLERTHGVPYDPHTTVVSRFLPPPPLPNASRPHGVEGDEVLARLVAALASDPDEAGHSGHHALIQARLDEHLPLVPLFAPQRLAVLRQDLPAPKLDHGMYGLDAEWLAAVVTRRR
ncbi:MAG: hypothetical protein JNK49_04990 [Planctomycetes bacterium]|nr:hypothetical protein [Planctomycetota bacterium]